MKKLLEEITKLVEEEKSASPDEPETLSKIYQKNYLIKEVDGVVRECKKIQVLLENSSANTVVKRILLLDPTLDEKQAEAIAKQKNGYEQLLKQKTLGKASQKLKDRVNDILEKDQEIKKLERSVAENLVMMKQIAVLVQQQGEQIDNIEQNLLKAKDYVEKATAVLHEEKKQHQRSRKVHFWDHVENVLHHSNRHRHFSPHCGAHCGDTGQKEPNHYCLISACYFLCDNPTTTSPEQKG